MKDQLRICLLEPYYGGSHKRWADGLKTHSRHAIDLVSLPDRHWKWRMHGAAVSFARRVIASGKDYDLILANDLMDVAAFTGLLRNGGVSAPVATYFHENQITYPWSPRDKDPGKGRDLHYGFINFTTALASKRVFFNSDYHRRSFLAALPDFLRHFPDAREIDAVTELEAKARTLPLGMDLRRLDAAGLAAPEAADRLPLLLWNHRWEYDKQPIPFLKLLDGLVERDVGFEVALLGPRLKKEPAYLARARRRLGPRIIQDGPVKDAGAYAGWLWRADILPVTSRQDFFGGSVVEAAYCGCHPLLPRRLAYPEHFSESDVFYDSEDEALDKLSGLIRSGAWRDPYSGAGRLGRYDWSVLGKRYDAAFEDLCDRHPARAD